MKVGGLVMGSRVDPELHAQARRFRREMTEAEQLLWAQLRANRLAGLHFRRQQVIRGFIVDFYCHAAGVVVEIDGAVHDRQRAADAERQDHLEGLGLRVVRFYNADVHAHLDWVLDEIAHVCGVELAR